MRSIKPFERIATLTDVAEGTIVRVITRLDETCREVRDAARVIGDTELFKKMEEAQNKIRRDSECKAFDQDRSSMTSGMLSQLCLQPVYISRTSQGRGTAHRIV